MTIFNSIDVITAKEVACERVNDDDWYGNVGTVKTCFMDQMTAIDTNDVNVSTRDDSVGGLDLSNNKNIFYLPLKVGENFPNLIVYAAPDCSIKEISKDNFKGLTKLKYLGLGGNHLETIANEIFSEIQSLQVLYMGEKNSIFRC